MIFDGREFAKKKELKLKKEVTRLKKKGITPKLVSVLIGDNPGSLIYVSLKKKAGERIGCIVEIRKFDSKVESDEVVRQIKLLNNDASVHGIMVQMPLPAKLRDKTKDIISAISREKDVDGLRTLLRTRLRKGKENSQFVPAAVKAVLQIVKLAKKEVGHDFENVVVVGASGMVGKPLVKLLSDLGYNVIKCDIKTRGLKRETEKADLLISATGVSNLIKEDMVKRGVAVIDVGSPKGDVDPTTSLKTSFVTPVPGGVGPVTIVSLLENLIISAKMGKPI